LADKLAAAKEEEAKSSSFLLDAATPPVATLDDTQKIKKNEDGSYSYSNSETGDKITFTLPADQFLNPNDYKNDPITTIYHKGTVLEESISETTV